MGSDRALLGYEIKLNTNIDPAFDGNEIVLSKLIYNNNSNRFVFLCCIFLYIFVDCTVFMCLCTHASMLLWAI